MIDELGAILRNPSFVKLEPANYFHSAMRIVIREPDCREHAFDGPLPLIIRLVTAALGLSTVADA